jgi:hypothetical protein
MQSPAQSSLSVCEQLRTVQEPQSVSALGAWWIDIPSVDESKLKTAEKLRTMTPAELRRYMDVQQRVWFNRATGCASQRTASGLLARQDAVAPSSSAHAGADQSAVASGMRLLDMQYLSAKCGRACTEDGIHFTQAVSDAALQNVLQLALRRVAQGVQLCPARARTGDALRM